MKQEIKTILQALDNKDPAVLALEQATLDLLDGKRDIQEFIYEIKEEIRVADLIHNDRQPFFFIYSAIAHWLYKEPREAQTCLANAAQGFRISGITLNEALVEWLFGFFHSESGRTLRAQQALEASIKLMRQLIKQCEDESRYEKAKKYSGYLTRVERYKEEISTSQNTHISAIRKALQEHHDELKNIYNDLRGKNIRVPPTLVASIFYTYKMLAPSHSVYSAVPEPETRKEKKLYNELLAKVGFFEVIEQLVELERERQPTATREELLQTINEEWDKDIDSL